MTVRRRRLCILGGTGFVGRRLVSRFFSHGYEVVVPTRNRARHRELLVMPLVELRQGDVHEPRFLRNVLAGADAAINLVGILNESGHDGSGFRRAHTELTAKVIQACEDLGVRRLLQMSALNADSERGASYYLKTKGEAENLLKRSALHYTIFQPSVIFGADDSFINRFAALLRRSPVLPLPRLKTLFAPVFVDDVAAAFESSLDDTKTFGRTLQLCGPDVYSFRELLGYICSTLGIKRAVFELPDALGKLQATAIDYLVPGKPFSLDNFHSLGTPSVCAEDGLGWLGINATPMSAVVPRMLRRWSRSQAVRPSGHMPRR